VLDRVLDERDEDRRQHRRIAQGGGKLEGVGQARPEPHLHHAQVAVDHLEFIAERGALGAQPGERAAQEADEVRSKRCGLRRAALRELLHGAERVEQEMRLDLRLDQAQPRCAQLVGEPRSLGVGGEACVLRVELAIAPEGDAGDHHEEPHQHGHAIRDELRRGALEHVTERPAFEQRPGREPGEHAGEPGSRRLAPHRLPATQGAGVEPHPDDREAEPERHQVREDDSLDGPELARQREVEDDAGGGGRDRPAGDRRPAPPAAPAPDEFAERAPLRRRHRPVRCQRAAPVAAALPVEGRCSPGIERIEQLDVAMLPRAVALVDRGDGHPGKA